MASSRGDATGPPVDARVARTRQDILRATLDVLISQGLDGLTHPHLAEVAGYSRATLYNHWPNRTALLRDAFTYRGAGEHSTPTGDLRSDLIAELTMFRTEMERHRLDRALAVLAAVTAFTPELAEVRDQLVAEDLHNVQDGTGCSAGEIVATRSRGRALDTVSISLASVAIGKRGSV